MSWAAKSFVGPAPDYSFELQSPADRSTLGPRPARIVEAVEVSLGEVVASLGDAHVSVTAYGHSGDEPGSDTIQIQIGTVAQEPG